MAAVAGTKPYRKARSVTLAPTWPGEHSDQHELRERQDGERRGACALGAARALHRRAWRHSAIR